MNQQEWFKIHCEQQKAQNPVINLCDDNIILTRYLQDVFDMGVAYGMDEMVARIKDKGNLSEAVEKELLERLDS